MFDNFIRLVSDHSLEDQMIESMFWLIYVEKTNTIPKCLELLGKHRKTLAKKIAKEILQHA